MTTDEVARLLGITKRTLSNRLSKGDACPPHTRLSQRRRIWLRSVVMAWLSENQSSGAPIALPERVRQRRG
ncbi:helix-turn-helix transcriptional regulator [Solimonas sp. K1W22B-7]|uniref:helix-turn-helix transcriptional regulator n=1 Tax=Solimonas sp. K1W22B-7 TaxID=2303331 RepID=UPI0013C4A41C